MVGRRRLAPSSRDFVSLFNVESPRLIRFILSLFTIFPSRFSSLSHPLSLSGRPWSALLIEKIFMRCVRPSVQLERLSNAVELWSHSLVGGQPTRNRLTGNLSRWPVSLDLSSKRNSLNDKVRPLESLRTLGIRSRPWTEYVVAWDERS